MNIKDYDIMQDRDMDESYSNGVWDLSYDLLNADLDQETLYNYLQDFKDIVKADLEAKLAEKEKKLYEANSRANELECNLELLNRCLVKDNEIINAKDQDKISFCIEKLEWVQKLLIDNAFNDLSVVLQEIDNQIEELKKEMR